MFVLKKTLIILLLGMYSFSVSGMTLHFNYCCGELSSIEFIATENCNEDSDPVACCSELEVQASLDDATHAKTFEFFNLLFESQLPQEISFNPSYSYIPRIIHAYDYSCLKPDRPLYLLNRVWRI